MDDQKYIVLKRSDVDALVRQLGIRKEVDGIATMLSHRLDDAVVIRRQDVFAPPALDAYASSIRVACELMPSGPAKKSLTAIADYFHEQAAVAWQQIRKVPD